MSKTENVVNFFPTKRLLVEIITRDINIHDSILDLIDNSVDSYVRHKLKDQRQINIVISNNTLTIEDNCGGIDRDTLLNHVFRSGELPAHSAPTIGYYGIGLKRALFKLAEEFELETYDGKNYSKITMNVNEWLNKGDKDWNLQLDQIEKSNHKFKEPFTKIFISKYKKEVPRILTSIFINDFKKDLSIYYTRIIDTNIHIDFNKNKLTPFDLAVNYSKEIKPLVVLDKYDKVNYKIFCWIEPKKKLRDPRERGRIGWNIFMNDRLILVDDKSTITGWSGERSELPRYHQLYYQFRGIVMIESKDPQLLPINTTKNNFNTEHPIYHHIRQRMIETARPVIAYLRNKYKGDEVDQLNDEVEYEIENDTKNQAKPESKSLDKLKANIQFKAPLIKKRKDTTRIIIEAPSQDVKKIKLIYKLKSNSEVGIHIFNYFLTSEGLENG